MVVFKRSPPGLTWSSLALIFLVTAALVLLSRVVVPPVGGCRQTSAGCPPCMAAADGAQEQQQQQQQEQCLGPPSSANPLWQYLPDIDIAISKIAVDNPFLYAFLSYDDDSFQVKDVNVRALEPGLTALWVNRTAECCRRGGTVVDVGSHFGYYSLLSSSLGCSFTAFEPVPLFASILHLNLQLNGLAAASYNGSSGNSLDSGGSRASGSGDSSSSGNRIFNAALAAQPDTVNMSVPKSGVLGLAHISGAMNEVLPENEWRVEVPQITLQDAFPGGVPPGGAEVCALKIDVEGYEPDVIKGGLELLRASRVPHIMLEFSPGYRNVGLLDMLTSLHDLGYSAIEVEWHFAKPGSPPAGMDMAIFDNKPRLNLTSLEARQAFINKVLPFYNTNVWFALGPQ